MPRGEQNYVQRYTGVVFDLKNATASFDSERYNKLKDLLSQVIAIDVDNFVSLQLAEKVLGVMT